MKDEPRRKWVSAIIESSHQEPDERNYHLTNDPYQLIKPEDFGWLLEMLLESPEGARSEWATVVACMIWNETVRRVWWDDFLNAYHRSPQLRTQMSWIEETSMNTPSRRRARAHWLRKRRRQERFRRRFHEPDARVEIDSAIAKISAGESWAFINLCVALSLTENGRIYGPLHHDITAYHGWKKLTENEQEFVYQSARYFLLEHSDGWDEIGTQTNYSEPGAAAVWLARNIVDSDDELRAAVGTKWIEAGVGIWDADSDHAKELFALIYRINPVRTINALMREVRRDCENYGHPFAIRRAEKCLDRHLAKELIEFTKTLKDPQSVRMVIYELKQFDAMLAGELAAYLLQREMRRRKFSERFIEALIIAGLGTGEHQVWRLVFPLLYSQPTLAKKAMLAVARDVDSRNADLCKQFTEDEIGDLYLLLCRLFPHSEDPEEKSGFVTPRRSVVHLRSGVLSALSARGTLEACTQLKRLAETLPDNAVWLHYRFQQTLSTVRRNEWKPCRLPDIAAIINEGHKWIVRDNSDLLNLVLGSLKELQQYLKANTLPAVEDLWHWEGAGLRRQNFRHKDEEAVSDYIARWLRDHIGPRSNVVVNREVQPVRQRRTDVLVQAWSHTPQGLARQELPLTVTIEVKGCWNPEIKTGAERQLLDLYLRPFGLTHGVFLVAWFFSPEFEKIAANQPSELACKALPDAENSISSYVKPAQALGFQIAPFLLDCRLL